MMDMMIKPVLWDRKLKLNVKDLSPHYWSGKVKEEAQEALAALEAGDEEAGREEIVDIITVCHSWLHALGVTRRELNTLVTRVNEKNAERGALEEH